MLIAVMSDCHDRLDHLEEARGKVAHAEALIFCGDFCAPFTLRALADGFRGPIHAVFGNNDGDVYLLLAAAEKAGNVTFHQPVAKIEMGGRQIAVAHYPEIGRALALSGEFEAVFSGHNHTADVQRLKSTLWGNPGELMGRFGRPSCGLYDTEEHKFEICRL